MTYLNVLLIAILLSGCGVQPTQEDRAQNAIDTYGPYCDRLGFKDAAWRDCVQKEASVALQNRALRKCGDGLIKPLFGPCADPR